MSRTGSRVVLSAGVVGTLATARVASAQVNVESLRKSLTEQRLSAMVSGSVTSTTGNSQGATASGAGQLAGVTGRHFAFAFTKADYARYNGATSISRTFLHARYNYEIVDGLWGEVFGQLQSDEFQRLIVRNLWGTGPRFALFRGDELDVFFGTAYMFEYTRIRPAPGSGDPVNSTVQRSSNYLSVSYQFDAAIVAGVTAYVQPKITEFSNMRALVEAIATFKVTKHLASSLSFTVRYDSRAPEGVKPTDTELKNSIALTF